MDDLLFYAVTEKCERGSILYVEISSHCPGLFICNPLDFDEINEKITGRKLVLVDSYLINRRAINAIFSKWQCSDRLT